MNPRPPFTSSGGKGGTFLLDAQVHTSSGLDNPIAQVERGQLLLLKIRDRGRTASAGIVSVLNRS
ncbi:MAG: hypothetical protein ABIP03_11320 [Aquihabitans sp.]